jgi:hypothetical protein
MATKTQKWNVVVVFAAMMLTIAAIAQLAPPAVAQEDIWSDKPGRRDRQFELTKERIEEILKHLDQVDPERAKELRKLQKDKPEEFQSQIRKIMRQQTHSPQGERKGQPQTRPWQGRWQEHVKKKHEAFLEWLKKNYPIEAQRLTKLAEKDAEKYTKETADLRKRYEPVMRAEKRDPELAAVLKEDIELQNHRQKLLREIRKADKKEKDELVKQLEEIVNRRFDLIVIKKQLRYEELRKRLKKLQEDLVKRQAELQQLQQSKQKTTEQRLGELLGKTERIDWK